LAHIEPFNLQSNDSECEDRTQVTRASVSGRTIKYSVDALNQCARVVHGGTAREVIEHRLDSRWGDLEQGAVVAYASTRRPIEIPVAALNQRGAWTTAVTDSDEPARKRIEHRLDPGRCDLEHSALGARAPAVRCAVEFRRRPELMRRTDGFRRWHRPQTNRAPSRPGRCDLEYRPLSARAPGTCCAVEIPSTP